MAKARAGLMNAKKIFLYLLGFLILIGLIIYSGTDWSVLLKIERPEFILLSIVVTNFVLIVLHSLKMRYLLKTLDAKTSFKKLIKIEYINKFAYFVFPSRLNIPVKAFLYHKLFNMGKGNAISVTTYEYALTIGAQLLIILAGIYFLLQGKLPYGSIHSLFFFVAFIASSIIVFFLLPLKLFDKIISAGNKRNNILARITVKAAKAFKAIRTTWVKLFFHKNMFLRVLPLIAIIFILRAISFELIFLSFGIYVPLSYILVSLELSLLAGLLSQIPGGLGAKEATLAFFLNHFGTPFKIILVAVILKRVLGFPAIAIGYFFSVETTANQPDLLKSVKNAFKGGKNRLH